MLRNDVDTTGRWNAAATLFCLLLVCVGGHASAAPAPTSATSAQRAYESALAASERLAVDWKSYEIAGTISVESRMTGNPEPMRSEVSFVTAAVWPNRLLYSQTAETEVVSLGTGPKSSWFHYGPMGTAYQSTPVAKLHRNLSIASELALDAEHVFNFYGGLGQLLLPAGRQASGEPTRETLAIDGRSVSCQVLALAGIEQRPGDPNPVPGPSRWWFDPSTGLCLKASVSSTQVGRGGQVEQTVVITATSLKVNGAVKDDRFAYTIPAGIPVVDHFDRLANPDALTGQPAPDATLTGLDGGVFKLSDLRGKVVFLDLWATWCGPCRIEMPHLETLHRELGAEVVFLAASSENKATVESFLQKNPYTFRIALISAEDAQFKFKAASIPTGFVIDKAGVIRAHLVGAQNEGQLRRALARVGVGK